MSTLENFLNAADIDTDNLENNRNLLDNQNASNNNDVKFKF